jgi:hypothetical protein
MAVATIRVIGRQRIVAVAMVAGVAAVPPADAQPRRWLPVARADLFSARIDAAHGSVGLTTGLGSYVRIDGLIGAGAARVADSTVASGRAEVVGRFVLDPFRQARWGPYVGAGLIARLDDGEPSRMLLALVVGTELPGRRQWVPALEVGYGGGVRVALALRRGLPTRR